MEQSNQSIAAATAPVLPDPKVWDHLLSGDRQRINDAVEHINAKGLADDYALLLLGARRRDARRKRRPLGLRLIGFNTPYTEHERRSALSALGVLWGGAGREIAMALDYRASHFEREHAHNALIRRRDQRAVGALLEALEDGQALEDWQCIATLGALGDLRAAEGLLRYVGLSAQAAIPATSAVALEYGLEVGRALRALTARSALKIAQQALGDSRPQARIGGALVVAGWGAEADAAIIVPLLQDADPDVQIAAAAALGELKVPETLPALQALESVLLQGERSQDVRQSVEAAIQRVSDAQAKRTAATQPRKFGTAHKNRNPEQIQRQVK